jgi:transposase
VTHFQDARHFSSWFGLTPREYSSGSRRILGRISKNGGRYLRTLLTHGARSVLRAAQMATAAEGEVCRVHRWVLNVQGCSKHSKATCALANKHPRICYAKLRDHAPLDEAATRLTKKYKAGRASSCPPACT